MELMADLVRQHLLPHDPRCMLWARQHLSSP
jgi:hypothetical protein